MIFLLFWGGFYVNADLYNFEEVVWPFYVLFILVIIERLAQYWIENRFGCTEKEIANFKNIEAKVKVYKKEALKKH